MVHPRLALQARQCSRPAAAPFLAAALAVPYAFPDRAKPHSREYSEYAVPDAPQVLLSVADDWAALALLVAKALRPAVEVRLPGAGLLHPAEARTGMQWRPQPRDVRPRARSAHWGCAAAPPVQVHVVEGNPACAEWIYEQLRANALGNVRLHAAPARAGASHCRSARAAAVGDSGGGAGALVELVADVTAEVCGRTGPSPALALVLSENAVGGADGDAGALGVWAAAVLAAGQAPRLVVAADAPRTRQVRVGRPSQPPVGSRGNAVGRVTKAVASRSKGKDSRYKLLEGY